MKVRRINYERNINIIKRITSRTRRKLLEEKGYIIDDSFSEKCVNSENYISDTYYRIRYGNHDEWFCYTAEYYESENEDYSNEGEFIRGHWNCNTKNDVTISELEL